MWTSFFEWESDTIIGDADSGTQLLGWISLESNYSQEQIMILQNIYLGSFLLTKNRQLNQSIF